jgi:hypothetical protein
LWQTTSFTLHVTDFETEDEGDDRRLEESAAATSWRSGGMSEADATGNKRINSTHSKSDD